MKKIFVFLSVFLACIVPRWYLLPLTGITLYHMRISVYFVSLFFLFIVCIIEQKDLKIPITGGKDVFVFFCMVFIAFLLFIKSINSSDTIREFYYLLLGLMSVVVMNLAIRDKKCFNYALGAASCAVLLHLGIGFFEILSHNFLFSAGSNDSILLNSTGTVKPVSIFYNNNDYGTFITVLLPLVVAFVSKLRRRLWLTMLTGIVIAAGVYIVVYAQSDVLPVTAIVMLLAIILSRLTKRLNKIQIAFVIVSLLVVVALIVQINYNSIQIFLDGLLYTERCRLNLIRNGLQFLRDSHGIGIGYGNSMYYLENFSSYDNFGIGYLHNWYVEILVGGGIASFLLYGIFHARKMRQLYQINVENVGNKDTSEHTVALCMMISFIGFTFVCISSSYNLNSEWLWMYFGLISAYTNMRFSPVLREARGEKGSIIERQVAKT